MYPLVILLGLDTNGLAVARSLGRQNVPLIILETFQKKKLPHNKTKYGKKFFLKRLTGQPLLSFLTNIRDKGIIFPTTDEQVLWLSEHRELIPKHFALLFPDKECVENLIDKRKFFIFCQKHSLPMAPYALVSSEDSIGSYIKGLRFPLIVKTPQKIYHVALQKAYIVQDKAELIQLWQTIRQYHNTFLIQEFIPGGDDTIYFCLQYINEQGNLLASFTGRKIRQWKPLCGGTASCEPITAPELHDLTFSIFQRAGFWGIGSVEFKYDSRDGKFYIIEPTVCRTDFQEQIAIVNGVNIPWIAYQDARGVRQKVLIKDGGSKAWMHVMNDILAAKEYMEQEKLTFWSWLSSLRRVRSFDLLSLSDPAPSITILRQKIRAKLSGIQ